MGNCERKPRKGASPGPVSALLGKVHTEELYQDPGEQAESHNGNGLAKLSAVGCWLLASRKPKRHSGNCHTDWLPLICGAMAPAGAQWQLVLLTSIHQLGQVDFQIESYRVER